MKLDIRVVQEALTLTPQDAGAPNEGELVAPKVSVLLHQPEQPGQRNGSAIVIMHPANDFTQHFLLKPLAQRGYTAVGTSGRYVRWEFAVTMERVLLDLAAVVSHLRETGHRKIVLIGFSGGGPIAAFYQSQAEHPSLSYTPAGEPPDLTGAELPPADAIMLLNAHQGRAHSLLTRLDPSVTDEADPYATDPALDMYNPENGPPYSAAFLQHYRAAQHDRNRRITRWVNDRLEQARRRLGPSADVPFVVYRTVANPAFVDLSIQPSDRKSGTIWGPPAFANLAANGPNRFNLAKSWLSSYGVETTNAEGPPHIARVSVPVLLISSTADTGCLKEDLEAYSGAIQHQDREFHTIKGATHFMKGQPELIEQTADLMARWLAQHDR